MQLAAFQSPTGRLSGFAATCALVAAVFATLEQPACAANTRGASRGTVSSALESHWSVTQLVKSDDTYGSMNIDAQGNAVSSDASLMQSLQSSGFQVEKQFLIISSPTLGKVLWTRLENFASAKGRSFTLIEDGLKSPMGIALDRNTGSLYVADTELQKIFAYTLVVDKEDPDDPKLTATARTEIMIGRPYKWVSVDDQGDVWYTSTDASNLDKITYAVIQRLRDAVYKPSALQLVSEKKLAAKAAVELKALKDSGDTRPTDAPDVGPVVYKMYEGAINPQVTLPGMLLADGPDLYWTNLKNGSKAGTVVVGTADPHVDIADIENHTAATTPFPAKAISLSHDVAYGLAVTGTNVLYTTNLSAANTGGVFCVSRNGGPQQKALQMVSGLTTPRGIVYDHDFTAYVADQDSGRVYSFPTGRLMENAPIKEAVTVAGAFAVAMFSESDPAYSVAGSSGAERSTHCFAALLLAVVGSIMQRLH